MSATASSTPKRPSRPGASHIMSSDPNGMPRSTEKELVDHFRDDLADATWEVDPQHLARALSAKIRQSDFEFGHIGNISNYHVALDDLDDVLEKIDVPPAPTGGGKSEESHYEPLTKYLNKCLDNCRSNLPKNAKRYDEALWFSVWNRETKDGVVGTPPIRPDLAGAFGLPENSETLSWCSESGKRSKTLDITVEVKDNWPGLVSQAATYARCLLDAVPQRQFALVIEYRQIHKEFRFLCFHAGGLMASRPLRLDTEDAEEKDNIFRLFLSLLTRNTRGDAGLPEWRNIHSMYIWEDRITRVKRILRGRNVRVLYLEPFRPSLPQQPTTPSSLPESPSKPSLPEAAAQKIHSSKRIAEQKEAKAASESQLLDPKSLPSQTTLASKKAFPRGSGTRDPSLPKSKPSRHQTRSTQPGHSDVRGPPSVPLPSEVQSTQASIKPYNSLDAAIEFTNHALATSTKHIAVGSDAVAKLAWVQRAIAMVESGMLKECSGMFGVVSHFHSQVIHHRDKVPTTNDLFYEGTKFWSLYKSKREPKHLDNRILMQRVSEFAGTSLVKADTPQNLFLAIIHAMLGYRNMLEKGYQHRDISIGNVLWSKNAKETRSVFETLAENPNMQPEQKELYTLLKECGMDKQCHGFVIDGDMSIKLKTYFQEEHKSSRSRTEEFMSTELLRAKVFNEDHLQSPLDDLWSFYWAAQWAAVFNPSEFLENKTIPMRLEVLRTDVADGYVNREFASTTIHRINSRTKLKYGTFLAECQPIFEAWRDSLVDLTRKWSLPPVVTPEDRYDAYYPHFRTITDQGIVHLLRIFSTQYPEVITKV